MKTSMRKKNGWYWLCLLILLAAGCKKECAYMISGTWEDADGRIVYLKKAVGDKQYVSLDSAMVQNGSFKMSGLLEQIDKRILTIGNKEEEILLDAVPITVKVTKMVDENGNKLDSDEVEITGSPEQEVLKEANSLIMGKAFLDLGSMFALVEVKDDSVKLDSVYKATQQLKQALDDKIKHFIDSCNNRMAITYVIGDFVAKNYPFEEVERYYDNLTPEVKASYPGQLLAENMKALREINVGGIAPDIDLATPAGGHLKLSSLRRKYVLLDFWASWCGPCLAEVPNVKAIYEEYKDKGFEIYGVSLDEDAEAWKNAIEKHGLTWLHVSSLKGWECPVAKRYNVTGIPKMYLLDKEGRIIAMDLRGEALKEKVSSLFNE